MQIIKKGQVVEDGWKHLDETETWSFETPSTLSLARFQDLPSPKAPKDCIWGIRIRPEHNLNDIQDLLEQLALVVLEMGPFTDGRSFTQARDLREQYGYSGEIRVKGDFLRDQMDALSRLGVDSFEFAPGTLVPDQLEAFREFSLAYQSAPNGPEPIYKMRSASNTSP